MALPTCPASRWPGATGSRARMARDDAVRPTHPSRPSTLPRRSLVPGKNLTRDEAASRAAILRVDSYDVRST